ncbi:transketolase [Patescibacteria group bacterium]|nr:transketolase [Patescibacteria group bacterium]MBU1673070.1 transketolase [Patescibacteria group bacterium]MBU1963676.1 transketolase [Patescibacteria group bacterium]
MEKVCNLGKLEKTANLIRQDIVKMLVEAGSGHTGGSLGTADIMTALYFNVLKHDPKKPAWKDRDYFVLSNGHIAPVLFATLARAGYFPSKELMTLRKLGTILQGHPNTYCPGVELPTGSLGQGVSNAVGLAKGLKIQDKDNYVFCMVGDGEIEEGLAWEAFMFAAHFELDNLTVICDRNFLQIDGDTEDVMALEPLADKMKAFGFHVIEIDGNNMHEVVEALERSRKIHSKPTFVLANTVMGKGVCDWENDAAWHGIAPDQEQGKKALKELMGRERS